VFLAGAGGLCTEPGALVKVRSASDDDFRATLLLADEDSAVSCPTELEPSFTRLHSGFAK
jgi:hypothetical protein